MDEENQGLHDRIKSEEVFLIALRLTRSLVLDIARWKPSLRRPSLGVRKQKLFDVDGYPSQEDDPLV